MTADDRFSDLADLIRDRHLPSDARLEAAASLVKLSRQKAATLLRELAEDEHEEEIMAYEVGALIGRIHFEDKNLADIPLHDFSESAYLGFDEEVGRLERGEA